MALWRDTMRTMRFFGIDARATAPMLLFLMVMRVETFLFAVVSAVGFTFLERKGLTFPAAIRAVRCWVAGDIRPAVPWWRKRRMIDYARSRGSRKA